MAGRAVDANSTARLICVITDSNTETMRKASRIGGAIASAHMVVTMVSYLPVSAGSTYTCEEPTLLVAPRNALRKTAARPLTIGRSSTLINHRSVYRDEIDDREWTPPVGLVEECFANTHFDETTTFKMSDIIQFINRPCVDNSRRALRGF